MKTSEDPSEFEITFVSDPYQRVTPFEAVTTEAESSSRSLEMLV
jgi:hypothetical protein